MEAPGHRAPAAPLYLFAFGSGAAALVYQVAWTKILALTFGRTTLAASAVVAAFMGGMGIGAWLYHRALGRRLSPLQLYAGLELGIALCAASMTAAFAGLPEFFASVAAFLPSGLAMDLFRVGFVLLALLLPAALMGATYPALCTALIHSREGVARHLGPIYGVNTVGAALGALLAGVVLIEHLGLRGSVLCAVAANVLIGVAALQLSRRGETGERASEPGDADSVVPTNLSHRVTAIVLFGSGLATLAYEILWFRALRYLFGNSTYAFSIMLVVFLTGLGAGGLLFARVARRAAPERDLALCQIAIALLALAAIGALGVVLSNETLEASVSIFYAAVFQMAWWNRLLLEAGVALAVMLPATLFMGLSFPLATRLYLGDVRRLGARVGRATLLANVGGICGSVVAAVAILPRLGTVGGTRAVATLNLALGLLVLARISGSTTRRLAMAATATAVVATVAALLPERLSFRGGGTIELLQGSLVFEEEGDLATVQVWANPKRPELRAMTIDGTAIGVSSGWNYALYSKQLLLAHLPMALDARTKHTLNVGLGSASTLDALASYPGVETLDVIEISRGVARASALFVEAAVLKDNRVRLVVEDVSHFLLRSDRAYDLIISDGKQGSDFSGNSAMLCREFYASALRRLSPEGILVQWIPLATPNEDVRVTLRTFSEVFPQIGVFMDAPQSMLMVGSRAPIAGRPRIPEARWRELRVARDLAPLGIPSRDALLARWVAGRGALRESVGAGPISTWDRTLFEFSAYKTRPDVWKRAPQANLALLLGAHRLALAAQELPPVPVDSPFVRSTLLVREALLEHGEGNRVAAQRLLERAVRANPDDTRAASLAGRSRAEGQSGSDRAAVRPARS